MLVNAMNLMLFFSLSLRTIKKQFHSAPHDTTLTLLWTEIVWDFPFTLTVVHKQFKLAKLQMSYIDSMTIYLFLDKSPIGILLEKFYSMLDVPLFISQMQTIGPPNVTPMYLQLQNSRYISMHWNRSAAAKQCSPGVKRYPKFENVYNKGFANCNTSLLRVF